MNLVSNKQVKKICLFPLTESSDIRELRFDTWGFFVPGRNLRVCQTFYLPHFLWQFAFFSGLPIFFSYLSIGLSQLPDSLSSSAVSQHFISFHHPRQQKTYRGGKSSVKVEIYFTFSSQLSQAKLVACGWYSTDFKQANWCNSPPLALMWRFFGFIIYWLADVIFKVNIAQIACSNVHYAH